MTTEEPATVIRTKVKVPPVSNRWKRFEGTATDAARLADEVGEPRQRNPPLGAPEKKDERTRWLERKVAIDELRAIAAKFKVGAVTEVELFRFARASVGVFTGEELRRLVVGWADHLEKSIAPKLEEDE